MAPLVLVLALLAAVVSASAPGAATPGGKSIQTAGRVLYLAADGTTVAAATDSTNTTCAQVAIWDLRRTKPALASYGCEGAPLHGDVSAVAVGGGMVGVIRTAVPHEEEDALSVTRPGTGVWRDITAVYDYAYAAGEGDYIKLFGEGNTLGFAEYSYCYIYNQGDTCPGVAEDADAWLSDGRLFQVVSPGGGSSSHGASACPAISGQDPNFEGIPWHFKAPVACHEVATGQDVVDAAAVDQGRFVVLPLGGKVTIVSTADGTRTTLAIPAAGSGEMRLSGNDLVIADTGRHSHALDDYDSTTGALLHRWPVARTSATFRLEDVADGLAAYVTGSGLSVLRLSDGKSYSVPFPKSSGPIHAALVQAGLVYSFQVPGKAPHGRVEFVPLAHVVARLSE